LRSVPAGNPLTPRIERPLSITGLGLLGAAGADVASTLACVRAGRVPFHPLGELLGDDSPYAAQPAGWIEHRAGLLHRKWSPATMAALDAARQAVADAGWSADDLRDAALVLGTSRGNAAGWLSPWPGRRPFKLMAASNTIHSEPAAAITIELGIHGPYQVLASGCSAGLDAAGLAAMMVNSGVAPRALVVAVDLPLVPFLLDGYAASGLLARGFRNDPYADGTSGFIPAEGAAAMTIEPARDGHPRLLGYRANSDACDPVGMPADGGRTVDLLATAVATFGRPQAVCPHTTGTKVQAIAEPAAFRRVFPDGSPTLHPLKPFTGHTIGASGLVETAICAAFLRERMLPPNLPGLTAPSPFHLPSTAIEASGPLFKLSHSMGGHNALLVLSPP